MIQIKKLIFALSLVLLTNATLFAQKTVKGSIFSATGEKVSGALVYELGNKKNSIISKEDGSFVLTTTHSNIIEVEYDFKKQKVNVSDTDNVEIKLNNFDRIFTFGRQQTTELYRTQFAKSISADEIAKNSSKSISSILRSYLRGSSFSNKSRLVIIDGQPRSISTVATEDIEDITVLSGASASIIYGIKAADQVLVVTTKRGKYNSKEVSVNYTHGFDFAVNTPEMADAYQYASAVNEALANDGLDARYSATDLDHFKNGTGDSDLYPNVNWLDEGLRKNTHKNEMNIAMRGGGEKLRYYTAINYQNYFGIYNTKYTEFNDKYDSQKRQYDLNMRVNLDIDFTKSTLIQLSLQGYLTENTRPYKKGDGVYGLMINTPSAAFPIRTSNDVWGSNNVYKYNPLAEVGSTGYRKMNQRILQGDLSVTQDLSYFIPGLSAKLGVSYDNAALYKETQKKDYEYEVNTLVLNSETGAYEKNSALFGNESNLSFSSGLDDQYINMNIDAQLAYQRVFNNHSVAANLTFRQEEWMGFNRNEKCKNQHLIAQAAYAYKNKYLVDAAINHSGSAYLLDDDKFRNYYAISAGWIMTEESFFDVDFVDFLKLRGSYGVVGKDALEYELGKQYWVYGGTYYFDDKASSTSGMKEGRLALENLEPIEAKKINFGFDATLFKNLTVGVDIFSENHANALIASDRLYSSVIGVELPEVNRGETKNNGYEISLGYKKDQGEFKYYAQLNMSKLATEVVEAGEGYKPHEYLYRRGKSQGQFFGLEAIGFFADQADIDNSPAQKFGVVKPGDVKYKDQNNDGIINQYDEISLGYAGYPEFYYGLRLGAEYRGFGIDVMFDAALNVTRSMNGTSIYQPLKNNSNISNWYLNDNVRWTEETKATANLPRLTTLDNPNNFRNSSLWMVDASYFSLRNINLFYNLPKQLMSNFGIDNCQVYIRGNNLLTLDKVDVLSATHFSISSPETRSLYLGIKFNF